MAAMSARGLAVHSSEEDELLTCRKAVEFAIDAGFSRLVLEGDNANVMQAIPLQEANISLLGNVVEDIKHLIRVYNGYLFLTQGVLVIRWLMC